MQKLLQVGKSANTFGKLQGSLSFIASRSVSLDYFNNFFQKNDFCNVMLMI